MPSHTHGLYGDAFAFDSGRKGGASYDYSTVYTQTAATGGSQSHTHALTDAGHSHTATATVNTIPPYIKLLFCIKLRAI